MGKRTVKRNCALLLTSAFLIVTACNNQSAKPADTGNLSVGNAEAKTNEAQPDDNMKYSTPITVTAARVNDANMVVKDGETAEQNVWIKAYEDAGIHLNYVWTADGGQYDNKMNVTIASGDMPDLFQVNALQLKQLVDSGELEDLTPLYQKYASPLTKQILGDDGGLAFKSATFKGKLMGLPVTQPTVASVPFLWIRADWLKKLNLSEPKTMNDVLKISQAFTTQDPDGNGVQDTFGLAAGKDLWGGFPGLEGIFNAYHAYPNIWTKDSSGKLAYGSVQPEMKNALAQLAQLYKAGQIDKEFGVKDAGKVAESVDSGKIGMIYGAWWLPSWPLQAGKDKDPTMEWKGYSIVSADDKPVSAQNGTDVSGYFAATKGSKHPEALIKLMNIWFDKMYANQAKDYLTYGIKKDSSQIFKYAFVYAWPPNHLSNDRSDHIVEALKANDPSKLNVEENTYYEDILNYRKGDTKNWYQEGDYGADSIWPAWHQLNDQHRVVQDEFYGAPTPTMTDKKASLDKMQNEEITKIIMGAVPVDDFDQFVSNWKKLGGDQITKEVNDWYTAQK